MERMRHSAMRIFAIFALLACTLTSCEQKVRSISISGTRERTLFDERFSGNIKDLPPISWRAIPVTQFRLKNFVAGPDDAVQIFLGQTQGNALDNANRWLGQFGANRAGNLEYFGKLEVLGVRSYLVEAEGDYGGGMGQEAQKDYAVVGVIRPQKTGVITIKMIGPKAAVAGVKEEFLEYCRSLAFHAPHYIEKTPEEK